MNPTPSIDIGARSTPTCYMCGAQGQPLYQGLHDRLFGATGVWNLKRCPNAQCDLLWLDPMPREEEIGKAYLSYYTHEEPSPYIERRALFAWGSRSLQAAGRLYLQGRLGHGERAPSRRERCCYPFAALLFALIPGGRDRLEATVGSLAAPRPGARLLEVGCGNGAQLARMRELGWNTVGVDTDHLAVRAAQARGLDVRLGPLESHAFPDASVDAIYSSHVLEHVYRPLELLQECRRILKPGGVAHFVTPNTASWGHQHFGSDWRGLEPPRHLMLFSPVTLRNLAVKAGYGSIQVRTTARYASYLCGISAMLQRVPVQDQSGQVPDWVSVGPWPAWAAGRAALYHIIENLLMTVRPSAGDEAFLIIRK